MVDTYHGFFFLLWQQTVGVKAELQMKSFYLEFKKKTLFNLTGIQLCTCFYEGEYEITYYNPFENMLKNL